MSKAMRQMPGQPGRASVASGEAVSDLASDEAWQRLMQLRLAGCNSPWNPSLAKQPAMDFPQKG